MRGIFVWFFPDLKNFTIDMDKVSVFTQSCFFLYFCAFSKKNLSILKIKIYLLKVKQTITYVIKEE